MSNFVLSLDSEPGVAEQERTCRYGHGPLTLVDRQEGRECFLAIAWGFADTSRAAPKYLGPLQWHLCGVCGYMELVDLTPSNSIERMGVKGG